MSIYLGKQQVGAAIPISDGEGGSSITPQELAELTEATNWRTGEFETDLSIREAIDKLKENYFITRDYSIEIEPTITKWTRPNSWPDLDSLNLQMSGDDYIYMTYDANQPDAAIALHIETLDHNPATVDIGHIEDGTYVIDESFSVAHNTNFIEWTTGYFSYLVVRITGQLTRCMIISATADDGHVQSEKNMPILERIAWIPHITSFYVSKQAWAPFWLQHEVLGNNEETRITSLASAYTNCSNLREIDLSNFHTKYVTSFASTFSGCSKLQTIDVSNLETNSVTAMNSMFTDCCELRKVILDFSDCPALTTVNLMFSNCFSLEEIEGIENFDTSNVTNFGSMFATCRNLKQLDIKNFITDNATNFSSMFTNCQNLQTLDLGGWQTENVNTLASMFNGCTNLKSINFTDWNVTKATTISSIFSNCNSLQHLDISWLHITDACTIIYYAFNNCWSLKELNFPEWDVSGLSNANNSANSVFLNCYSLKKITGIKDWDFQLSNSIASMFSGCYSLKEVDVSGWNVDTVTSLASIFQNCNSLSELDLSLWDPKKCTSFLSMFNGCYSLKTVGDISGWTTENVTTMATMFADCYSLEQLPGISAWNVAKVTTTASMFSNCRSLKEIYLDGLVFTKLTTMATMFRYCYGLEYATLTNWQLPALTTAPAQFLGDCWNLQEIEINLPIKLNHSYANDRSLSHQSLLNILNGLPTVTTTRTLNLTATNLQRLTADEKAIATSKGWTLAN